MCRLAEHAGRQALPAQRWAALQTVLWPPGPGDRPGPAAAGCRGLCLGGSCVAGVLRSTPCLAATPLPAVVQLLLLCGEADRQLAAGCRRQCCCGSCCHPATASTVHQWDPVLGGSRGGRDGPLMWACRPWAVVMCMRLAAGGANGRQCHAQCDFVSGSLHMGCPTQSCMGMAVLKAPRTATCPHCRSPARIHSGGDLGQAGTCLG
jgi:hypothetical protein